MDTDRAGMAPDTMWPFGSSSINTHWLACIPGVMKDHVAPLTSQKQVSGNESAELAAPAKMVHPWTPPIQGSSAAHSLLSAKATFPLLSLSMLTFTPFSQVSLVPFCFTLMFPALSVEVLVVVVAISFFVHVSVGCSPALDPKLTSLPVFLGPLWSSPHLRVSCAHGVLNSAQVWPPRPLKEQQTHSSPILFSHHGKLVSSLDC